ncbi:MAG: molybdate ABC transporter substrate-binding protein [Chloroflexi bacterium]|nr:molybdate ABC transporter substrate-binding protein [Chloroflexota bacterium]
MKRQVLWLVVCALLLTLVPAAAQEGRTLVVFAASSLTDAFEEIGAGFAAANPGVEVLFNFAGTSELVAQLSEGAPADIFASANPRQMQAVVDAGRIGAEPQTFAHNRLVLIVPSDNPAGIETLHDVAAEGVQLVVAAEGVPVRDYTDTMLERMAENVDYGYAYRELVLLNIVSEEPNVRQVAAKVALGEADAGFVYVSDITPDIQDDVITIDIPDAFNTIASYPIAMTDNPTEAELAQAFVEYILSDAGQDVLEHWNFVSIREPEAEATPEATPEATQAIDCAPVETEEEICAVPPPADGEGGIGIGSPNLGG